MKKMFAWLGGKKAPPAPIPEPSPLRTMADIDALIAEGGFEPAADLIRRGVRPSLSVIVDGEASAAIGATRFGGLPDLPLGTPWPTAPGGEHLTFLAQVDLADVATRAGPSALPSEGLLSIFAGNLQDDPQNAAAAILTPPGSPLARLAAPQTPDPGYDFVLLKPVAVTFEPRLTLAVGEPLFDNAIEAAAPDGNMDTLQSRPHDSPDRVIGQMLGHAGSYTDDLHSHIAMRELGWPRKEKLLIWRTWEAWEDAKRMESKLRNGTIYRPWRAEDDDAMRFILANRDRIAAEGASWQVLLKVESNKPMDLWTNDADPVFVFIRTDDLAARNFSNLRAIATQS